jgi:hypothetical protein
MDPYSSVYIRFATPTSKSPSKLKTDIYVGGSWVFIRLIPDPSFRPQSKKLLLMCMVSLLTNSYNEAEFRVEISIEERLVPKIRGHNEIFLGGRRFNRRSIFGVHSNL